MIRTRKVGGIRFVRIGRLSLSFCVCKPLIPERFNPRVELPMSVFVLACLACAGWIAGGM